MIYRCFLDGRLVSEPIGLDELSDTLSRNSLENGITYSVDIEITFVDDGYDYLLSQRETVGFTKEVALRIEQSEQDGSSWFYFFEGLIFLTHVKFYEAEGSAKCQIVDNSYYARIENNKAVPFFLYGSKSKNNVDITPCTDYQIQYFDVSTGNYIAFPVAPAHIPGGYEGGAYKIFEVLRFAVEWMADGDITIVSDAFGSGGEYEDYFITHGRAVELFDCTVPGWSACTRAVYTSYWDRISYQTIIKEIGNLFNLKFGIETVGGRKAVRIEPDAYWTDETTVLGTLDEIEEIVTSVNTSLLYSSVKVGTSETYQDDTMLFPENIDYLGYKSEELPVIGTSNIGNNALDIQTTWFKSSNVFQYLLYNGTASDKDWDRKVGIVHAEFDSGSIYKAKQSDFLGTGYKYYNESLTNSSVLQRFLGGVPSSLASYLGSGDDEFQASCTTSQSSVSPALVLEPFPCDNDSSAPNFDTNNNYDAGLTYEYTIPQSGVFTFGFDINTFISAVASFIRFSVSFVRYDSSGYGVNPALSEHFAYYNELYPVGGNHLIGSASFIANAGEKIVMKITSLFASRTTIQPNALFKCINTTTGGGIYQTYNPEDINIYLHEFEYPFAPLEMKRIINNPKGIIEFALKGKQLRKGRIEIVKEKYQDGKAKFTLSSTKKLNN